MHQRPCTTMFPFSKILTQALRGRITPWPINTCFPRMGISEKSIKSAAEWTHWTPLTLTTIVLRIWKIYRLGKNIFTWIELDNIPVVSGAFRISWVNVHSEVGGKCTRSEGWGKYDDPCAGNLGPGPGSWIWGSSDFLLSRGADISCPMRWLWGRTDLRKKLSPIKR